MSRTLVHHYHCRCCCCCCCCRHRCWALLPLLLLLIPSADFCCQTLVIFLVERQQRPARHLDLMVSARGMRNRAQVPDQVKAALRPCGAHLRDCSSRNCQRPTALLQCHAQPVASCNRCHGAYFINLLTGVLFCDKLLAKMAGSTKGAKACVTMSSQPCAKTKDVQTRFGNQFNRAHPSAVRNYTASHKIHPQAKTTDIGVYPDFSKKPRMKPNRP